MKWLLLAPACLLCAVFVLWPMAETVVMSFEKSDYITTEFVGLANYAKVLTSPQVWQTVANSGLYMLIITVCQVSLAIFVALSVMHLPKRWQDATRIITYLPALSAGIIIALIYRWIFHQDGPVNWALGLLGVQPVHWFSSWTAIPVISGIVIISGFGGYVMMAVANIASIDRELFDAARIDGASEGQIKRRIVLPILSPTIGMMALLTAISAPQIIETIISLAPYDETATMAFRIYVTAFQDGKHGQAAAMSILFLLIISAMTLAKFKLEKRR